MKARIKPGKKTLHGGGFLSDGNNDIDQHVRRLIGIATLRRLRRMVDSENTAEADAAIQAKRFAIPLMIIAVIFVAGLALMMVRAH